MQHAKLCVAEIYGHDAWGNILKLELFCKVTRLGKQRLLDLFDSVTVHAPGTMKGCVNAQYGLSDWGYLLCRFWLK